MIDTTNTFNNFTIGLWNCNSIKKHKAEIMRILNKKKLHIFCINETKLNSNETMKFDDYNIMRTDRNSRGGGVATLIHNNLSYEKINNLDSFGFELIATKVKLKNIYLNIINVYIPPRKNNHDIFFCSEFFEKLKSLEPFILCGDFNSHSKNWNCTKYNKNSFTLEKLLENSNYNVINNQTHTHRWPIHNSESTIDLLITSADLNDKQLSFQVKTYMNLNGHYPVIATFKIASERINEPKKNLVKHIINWDLYKTTFSSEFYKRYTDWGTNNTNTSLQDNYQALISLINQSTNAETITKTRKINHKTLPKHILDIINARKRLIKDIKKYKQIDSTFSSMKQYYNQLTKIIKEEINSLRVTQWTKFCNTINETTKFSGDYWKKIKQTSSQVSQPKKKNNT